MIVIDSRSHFAASKRRDWWEAKMKLFRALAQFLTDEKFCRSDVLARFEAEPTAWQLTEEDLTLDGMRWIKESFHPWLRRLDRRKAVISFEEMLESLRKTRNA